MWQIAWRRRLLQIDWNQAVLKGTKGMEIAGYKLRALGRVVLNLPDIALWPITGRVGSMRPSELYQDLLCIRNNTFLLCMWLCKNFFGLPAWEKLHLGLHLGLGEFLFDYFPFRLRIYFFYGMVKVTWSFIELDVW